MKQTRRQFLVASSLVMAGAVVTKSYPKIKDKGTLKGPVCISTWSHGYVANKSIDEGNAKRENIA